MSNVPRTFLEADAFKILAKEGKATDALVRKGFATEVKADADTARALTFLISDASVDRDNDTIAVTGWDLNSFAKSGSMLWAHDPSQPPVAAPLATWVEGPALYSKAQFMAKEDAPFSYMVYRMYCERVLKGVSVGFKPLEYKMAERGDFCVDFLKQELLEYSATPVPANPNAVMRSKSLGIDVSPLVDWATRMLDEHKSGLSVPREQLEATLKEVAPTTTVQVPAQLKRGRTLSKANQTKLERAQNQLDEAKKHLDEVLSTVAEAPEVDDGEKCVDKSTPPPVSSNSPSPQHPEVNVFEHVARLFGSR